MEKKGHFLRKTAGLLALVMVLTLCAAGCGQKPVQPDQPDEPDPGVTGAEKPTDVVLIQPDDVEVPVDFETAQKAWPDVYAYIKIPGASNMAIREGNFLVQRPGNDDYYLNRDLDGKDNKAGTLYTQASVNKPDMSDPVTVIYGHNMRNGTMLGGLLNYANAMSFGDDTVVEVYQPVLEVPGQQVRQRIGGAGRCAAQDGQIFLGEAAVTQLPGQQGGGHAAAGKDHDPRHLSVQPVNGADAVGVQLGAEQLRHAAGLIGGQYADGFDGHHDPRVLVENIQGRHLLRGVSVA